MRPLSAFSLVPPAAFGGGVRLAVVAGAFLLAACTGGLDLGLGIPYGTSKPRPVNRTTYVPRANPAYDVVGIASWYGGRFHGRRTASGEVYNKHAYTAAHRTLPFGTRVRVINLENGRSVVLTVNDRGPFVRGRIIDVSQRAARALGFMRRGIVRVRVTAVGMRRG
ncbi:MAG: septal ring lytic transglycosylase RlpA family protein [Alphaproteobacteria bacterium]